MSPAPTSTVSGPVATGEPGGTAAPEAAGGGAPAPAEPGATGPPAAGRIAGSRLAASARNAVSATRTMTTNRHPATTARRPGRRPRAFGAPADDDADSAGQGSIAGPTDGPPAVSLEIAGSTASSSARLASEEVIRGAHDRRGHRRRPRVGRPDRVAAEPIGGGLTNRNYRVEVDGTPYFVRIPGAGDRAAGDRSRQRAAQHAGGGARPASGRGSSITLPALGRHRPRVAARPDDVERGASPSPGCPSGSPATLRRLHAGPRFRATSTCSG